MAGNASAPGGTTHEAVRWAGITNRGCSVMRMSDKDRLIIALSAQLRAERETREALASVIGNGQIDRDVLLAILEDPIPAPSREDLVRADALAAIPRHVQARAA